MVPCVAVVDDEASIRNAVQALLEVEGSEVATAANADEAIAPAGARAFQVAGLDIRRPGILAPAVANEPGDPGVRASLKRARPAE